MSVLVTLRLRCDQCDMSKLAVSNTPDIDVELPWVIMPPEHVRSVTRDPNEPFRAFCSRLCAQGWADIHKHPSLASAVVEYPELPE